MKGSYILALLALGAGVICGIEVAGTHGVFISIPKERDPQLVGTWNGRNLGGNRKVSARFFADGTAQITDWGPVTWGTEGETLHLKFRSAGEGWNRCRVAYRVRQIPFPPDREWFTLSTARHPRSPLLSEMSRLEPKAVNAAAERTAGKTPIPRT